MAITVLDAAGRQIELSKYLRRNEASTELYALLENQPALALLLVGAILGHRVEIGVNGGPPDSPRDTVFESPAQVTLPANFLWISKSTLEQILPKVAEIPYQAEHQPMTTIHRFPKIKSDCDPSIMKTFIDWGLLAWDAPYIAFASGKVGDLLNASCWILLNGWIEPLSHLWRTKIMDRHNQLNHGSDVFGIAFRPVVELPSTNGHLEDPKKPDLIFIGMIATTPAPKTKLLPTGVGNGSNAQVS
ncbi:MAG: hypothetical protein ACK2TV_10445 [Anaerolineales bacterium]